MGRKAVADVIFPGSTTDQLFRDLCIRSTPQNAYEKYLRIF